MSDSIGHIIKDSLGDQLTHSPSKSFGDLFEEKKSKLDALQAGLARAVLPKTPPMPAVTDTKRPLLIPTITKRDYSMTIYQIKHIKNNQYG